MNLQQLQQWFLRMEKLGEADIPYLRIDNRFLTPKQILEEAQKNSPLWQKIKQIMGDPPVYADFDLLKERIMKKYKQGKLGTIIVLGRVLTPEKQIEEIEKGSTMGYNLLLAEAMLLEELEKKRKEGW